jgi:hypothetical protein
MLGLDRQSPTVHSRHPRRQQARHCWKWSLTTISQSPTRPTSLSESHSPAPPRPRPFRSVSPRFSPTGAAPGASRPTRAAAAGGLGGSGCWGSWGKAAAREGGCHAAPCAGDGAVAMLPCLRRRAARCARQLDMTRLLRLLRAAAAAAPPPPAPPPGAPRPAPHPRRPPFDPAAVQSKASSYQNISLIFCYVNHSRIFCFNFNSWSKHHKP